MPEDTEDLELLTSGRIRAVIDGKTYTLRRPNIGQMRAFRESFTDIFDEAAQMLRTKHPQMVLKDEPDADEERKILVGKEWRQANIEFTDHVVAWVKSAFDELAEPSTKEMSGDDFPAWAGEQDTINAIYKHWRERPFNSGGQ